jgi:hypothetical protein
MFGFSLEEIERGGKYGLLAWIFDVGVGWIVT